MRLTLAVLGTPTTVRWRLRDTRGHAVSGWVLLHAGLQSEEQLVVWTEVVVDQRGEPDVQGYDRRAGLDARGVALAEQEPVAR